MDELAARKLGNVIQYHIRNTIWVLTVSRLDPCRLGFKFDDVKKIRVLLEHRLYRRRISDANAQLRQRKLRIFCHEPLRFHSRQNQAPVEIGCRSRSSRWGSQTFPRYWTRQGGFVPGYC